MPSFSLFIYGKGMGGEEKGEKDMKTVRKVNRFFRVSGVLPRSLVLSALVLLIAAPCLAAGPDYYADLEGWFISHAQGKTVIEMQFYAANSGGNPPQATPTLRTAMWAYAGQSPQSLLCESGFSMANSIPPMGENSKVYTGTFWVVYPDPPGSHIADYGKRSWSPNDMKRYGQFGNGSLVPYRVVGEVQENGIPPANQDTNTSNNQAEKDGSLPGGGTPSCWHHITPPSVSGPLGSR